MARRRGFGSASGDCAVYVGTKNDVNGNPRRGWLVDTGGGRAVFVDEGYGGRQSLKQACPTATQRFDSYKYGPLQVEPGEYRALKKLPGTCPGGKKY